MTKVNLFDQKGKKASEKIELDKSIFEAKVNDKLLSHYVYAYLSNQREANAHTKDRSEVSGGGRKPWQQKGTGRARHGSNRSPIWKGGGVSFGPTNERNYKKKVNAREKRMALVQALSLATKSDKLNIIETFEPKKTKDVAAVVKNMGIASKITFIQSEEKGLHNSSKNIEKIEVLRVGELNAYDILKASNVVILKDALDEITKKLGSKKTKKSTK